MKKQKLSLKSLDPEIRAVLDAALDKKAEDILVLDLRGLASFTDFFVICTGNSNRQLKSIADQIEVSMKSENRKPTHVEGYPKGDWILMDYVDFIVHIFTPSSRRYFDLERLWGDAERLAVAS